MTRTRPGQDRSAEPQALHQRVYDTLRQKLQQGDFHAGETLTLGAVSEAMGTSHMPVREAVRRLVAEKAITQSSNRAFTVPLLSPDELNELVELRLYLETLAARSACGRIDADSLRSLMALNGRMRAQLEEHDKRGALQSNQAFHFTLYRAGASTVLMDMIELLWLRCGPYLAAALFAFSGGERHFGIATELHEEIIRGLLDEDADRVSRALTADLQKTADWYRTQSSGAVAAALADD